MEQHNCDSPSACPFYDSINKQQFDNAKLLSTIDTKLKALLWVLGVMLTVCMAPATAYLIHLEARMQKVEHSMNVIVQQRNADHPTKDKLLY